jgi:hypothetical protein
LANPRKYEVTRDIGENLAATEYADDLNLHGYGDTYPEDSDNQEDDDFIDDTSLPDFSSVQSESGVEDWDASIPTVLPVDNCHDSHSSASTAHSSDNEGEGQEAAGTCSTSDSAETNDTTTVRPILLFIHYTSLIDLCTKIPLSEFVEVVTSTDGEQSYKGLESLSSDENVSISESWTLVTKTKIDLFLALPMHVTRSQTKRKRVSYKSTGAECECKHMHAMLT